MFRRCPGSVDSGPGKRPADGDDFRIFCDQWKDCWYVSSCNTLYIILTTIVSGSFSETNELLAVEIQLDVADLLRLMIDKASQVVSKIVGIASHACGNHGKHQISRSASFLSMPPPPNRRKQARPVLSAVLKPRPNKRSFGGLELLSQAAANVAVVSPDLRGSTAPCLLSVPRLDLEEAPTEMQTEESTLSVDQCVDIIDTCLFTDDDRTTSEPTTPKRRKLDPTL